MSNTCKVCRDPDRLEIEKAINAGRSLRAIAGQYGPSRQAIGRHKNKCMVGQIVEYGDPEKVGKVKEIANNALDRQIETLEAERDTWTHFEELQKELKDITRLAREKMSLPTAISAIREQGKLYEIILKLMAEKRAQEDPYELKYHKLKEQVTQLYRIVAKTLTGHEEIRSVLLEAIDQARAEDVTIE